MTQDFTIADVLAWAGTKPASERYYYGDVGNCALCQFLRETGRATKPRVGGFSWSDDAERSPAWREIPKPLDTALIGGASGFGGLVERLEALCPDIVITPSDWSRLDAYMDDIKRVSA